MLWNAQTLLGDDKFINVWDIGSGKLLDSLIGHTDCIHSLDYSQEGTCLASGGADCTVRLWDMSKAGVPESDSTFDPKRVSVAQQNQSILPSKTLLKTFKTRGSAVYRVQFTPKNLMLVGCNL